MHSNKGKHIQMEMVDGDTDHNSIVATVKSKRNCKKKQENEFRNEEKNRSGIEDENKERQ